MEIFKLTFTALYNIKEDFVVVVILAKPVHVNSCFQPFVINN